MNKTSLHIVIRTIGLAALLALAALHGLSAQAQAIYRIVSPDGKVSFSDQPPTSNAQVSALPPSGRSDANTSGSLPYEVRQAANRYPVTLYTGDGCDPCSSGRSALVARGVPFREFTVTTQEDVIAFQKQTGESSLPVLAIGGQRIKGFSSSDWARYLDAAGYPPVSQLPPSYRNPAAMSLATSSKPRQPTAEQTNSAPLSAPPASPAVTQDNPTGIIF